MVLKHSLGGSSEKPALDTSLMELILATGNVNKAWKQVKSNGGSPGIDGITVERFPDFFRPRWPKIKQALLQGYYIPKPVKRVEIPKDSGGTRKLGVPTVLDRVIQQAMAQVLGSIFDPGFSEASFGFRPSRSAHGAIRRIHGYVKSGYHFAVDVDIEKFFDNVNHDILMYQVSQKVTDKSVLKLIGRYLRAGVLEKDGRRSPSLIGTPQGGPLSPLLSNILLHELDVEAGRKLRLLLAHATGLERKQQCFARYADDFVIVTKSKEEGEAIMGEVTSFLDVKLKLKVNTTKSAVVPVDKCAFLSFTFRRQKLTWTDKAFKEFQYRIKKLTGRSWGVSMVYRMEQIRLYVTGWMNYFGIAEYYSPIQDIDNWIRRRIRICYWKAWRHVRTKVRKLKELGVQESFAKMTGSSSKSYWKLSKTSATNAGMSNEWLEKQGLVNVKSLWCKAQGYT